MYLNKKIKNVLLQNKNSKDFTKARKLKKYLNLIVFLYNFRLGDKSKGNALCIIWEMARGVLTILPTLDEFLIYWLFWNL